MVSRSIRSTAVAAILVLCSGLASACARSDGPVAVARTDTTPRMQAAVAHPTAPRLATTTPIYPAVAVYIVYREYLHHHPSITRLSMDDPAYQAYMERRLRQLYPTRGYSGMMRDAVREARRNREAWDAYERASAFSTLSTTSEEFCAAGEPCDPGTDTPAPVDLDPSWVGQQEFPVPPDEELPTLAAEVDSMQMEPEEVQEMYYYESLATGTYSLYSVTSAGPSSGAQTQPSRDDLIRMAAGGSAPGEVHAEIAPVGVVALVGLGIAAWKAYRVHQAKNRAIQRSDQFYPSLPYSDSRRDAHRHIFLNVQLRRYVGGAVAKQITDWYESQENNAPAGRWMDYHNNDIGRDVKYNSFRGHWLWDRWDWKEWAEKVRNYINHEENGAFSSSGRINPGRRTKHEPSRVSFLTGNTSTSHREARDENSQQDICSRCGAAVRLR
jgi:hypothetical protein